MVKALVETAQSVFVYVLVYTKPQGDGFERSYFKVTKKEAREVLDEIDHEGEDPEVHATYENIDSALFIGALPK